MELNGKKLVFLGDSITEGYSPSRPEEVYWNVLAERTGAICRNFGISTTRIARQQHPSADPAATWDQQHFSTRIEQMDPDADAVIVFGGTNDFGHGDAPFGSFDDRTEDTFYGALHSLCLKLLERYPGKEIVFLTPLHRTTEDIPCDAQKDGRVPRRLVDYRNAIIEVAEYYGLPVLDLYAVSGMQPRVPIIRETLMPDGLHPNTAGHARIADRLEGFLRAL